MAVAADLQMTTHNQYWELRAQRNDGSEVVLWSTKDQTEATALFESINLVRINEAITEEQISPRDPKELAELDS